MTTNFTRAELACKHCGWMHIPMVSIERLQRVRDKFGRPIIINSAYRCPTHNIAVSNTGSMGPHTKSAFDIRVYGAHALELIQIALSEGFTGIGVKQTGPQESRFIHLDDLPDRPGQPRPWIWGY